MGNLAHSRKDASATADLIVGLLPILTELLPVLVPLIDSLKAGETTKPADPPPGLSEHAQHVDPEALGALWTQLAAIVPGLTGSAEF